jgi:uncharacterized membrane protein
MTSLKIISLKPFSSKAALFKTAPFDIGWLNRLLAFSLWLTALLFVAGLVHLVSVFTLPELAQKDAFSRLSAFTGLTPPGQVSLLPAPLPGQEYAPFEDPALVQGVCLFDLDRGPLTFSAEVPSDELLTFSFRTRTGRVFYSMTDRAASHKKLDVIVLTGKQLEAFEADDDGEELPQELHLTAPQKKGFILINALVAFPSERTNVEALVKSMTCETDAETTAP